jgi:hypothetical protein
MGVLSLRLLQENGAWRATLNAAIVRCCLDAQGTRIVKTDVRYAFWNVRALWRDTQVDAARATLAAILDDISGGGGVAGVVIENAHVRTRSAVRCVRLSHRAGVVFWIRGEGNSDNDSVVTECDRLPSGGSFKRESSARLQGACHVEEWVGNWIDSGMCDEQVLPPVYSGDVTVFCHRQGVIVRLKALQGGVNWAETFGLRSFNYVRRSELL